MTARLSFRDGQQLSEQQIRRIYGSLLTNLPVVAGVGAGYAAGGVGSMNPNQLGASPNTGHFAISATGTDRVLTIAPGWGWVVKDSGAASYAPEAYFVELGAPLSATAPANATGGTRNDQVCLVIDEDPSSAPDAIGSNVVSMVIVPGASGGGLTAEPAGNQLYLPLAVVAVANGAASIAQANVADRRNAVIFPNANPYRARAYATGATTLVDAAFTVVKLAGVTYDFNGNWDTGAWHYRVPATGYYDCVGVVPLVDNPASGQMFCSVFQNGTERARGNRTPMSVDTVPAVVVADTRHFIEGDYIDLRAYQESGANHNVAAPGEASAFLKIELVAVGN